jgi:hypothetical protein
MRAVQCIASLSKDQTILVLVRYALGNRCVTKVLRRAALRWLVEENLRTVFCSMVSKAHVRKLAGDHYLTQVGKGRGRAVHLEIEAIYLATEAKRVRAMSE